MLDVLFDVLTVREHLWFFCKLKEVPDKEVSAHIKDMLRVRLAYMPTDAKFVTNVTSC